ncbi:MAG: hypothetical protein IPK26_06570 [Planctomycetes bacterium]|nr:hypothetical protein [Planctomycetota bacterium]
MLSSIALEGQELAIGSNVSLAPFANAGQVAAFRLGSGSMPFGSGLPGSGSLVPELFGTGCPRVGHPYSVDLARGLGGAFSLLAIGFQPGQVPVFGSTVWISAIGASTSIFLGGAPSQAGAGAFQYPFAVPSAAFVGLRFYFQAGVRDAAAAQGVALSNALEVVTGL